MDGVAELIHSGMAALRAGEPATARTLLARATQLDPNNEQAWLWLSGAVATPAEQRHCLEQVLRINAQSVAAKRGLEKLPLAPTIQAPPPPLAQPSVLPVQSVQIQSQPSAFYGFIQGAWPGLLIMALILVPILVWFSLSTESSSSSREVQSAPEDQSITTANGTFRVPGIAFLDGRALDGTSPATMMTLNVWDAVPRQHVVCTIAHGERVSLLAVQQSTSEDRSYFKVANNACTGWISESLVSDRSYEVVGDRLP